MVTLLMVSVTILIRIVNLFLSYYIFFNHAVANQTILIIFFPFFYNTVKTALLNKKKPVPQKLSCVAPAIYREAGNRGATMVNDMTAGRKKYVCNMN